MSIVQVPTIKCRPNIESVWIVNYNCINYLLLYVKALIIIGIPANTNRVYYYYGTHHRMYLYIVTTTSLPTTTTTVMYIAVFRSNNNNPYNMSISLSFSLLHTKTQYPHAHTRKHQHQIYDEEDVIYALVSNELLFYQSVMNYPLMCNTYTHQAQQVYNIVIHAHMYIRTRVYQVVSTIVAL